MGNQIATSQSNEDIGRLLIGLENFTLEGEPIESNKIFTTVKLAPDQSNLMLSKVHIKNKDLDITSYMLRFEALKYSFATTICPNLLLCDYLETNKLVIIFRQYCSSTLRKKIISPPFLNLTEKLWLSYQCLLSVKQIHDMRVCHGDIKSENFLTTSWNWLFLADISNFYKPSYLIEGDLTSYKYFYSNSERPACYLPPEKFSSKQRDDALTQEMDIFSLGCVIAEIFLDGQCLFTLPELLSYKRSILKSPGKIGEIKNDAIRSMINSMISLLPEDRKAIDYYVKYWETNVISFEMMGLYPVIAQIMIEKNGSNPWARISSIVNFYENSSNEFRNSEVLLILAEYITGNIRNVKLPFQMAKSIEILAQIGSQLTDDSKLHRILPFLISILQNKQERSKVKVVCINSLIIVLDNIKEISARDTHLFVEYIWPVISSLIHDESDWVRSELAASLPKFAKIGRVFFDASQNHFKQEINYDKEIAKFTTKFIRIFKDLIVSKPECQIQIELLKNFANLAEYLDMRSVLNNIIPIVLSWLNKGDSYRVLILSQIPKLLDIIHTPEFFSQIFTCIEDGLTLHNELVVYSTLKVCRILSEFAINSIRNMLLGLLHPNWWIRSEIINILKTMINNMEDYENYSLLRDLMLQYVNLPKNSVAIITIEIFDHIYEPFTRKDFTHGIYPSDLYQKIHNKYKTKETLKVNPLTTDLEVNYQIFEEADIITTSPLIYPRENNKIIDSLNLKGNLQGCFNDHESSVTNICAIENSNIFLSGSSSDGKIKLWNFSQLEPFKSIKSQDFFRSEQRSWKLKNIGNYGENVFMAYDQGIILSPLSKFSIQTVIPVNRLLKAISIGDNHIASVDQQGLLCIYDIRQNKIAQQFKLENNYGVASCLCKGPASNTLGIGTLSSTLIIYDMRFVCPSMIYSHSSGLPILTMQSYSSNSILIGGNEISLLDLNSATTTVVLASYSQSPTVIPSFREIFDNEWIVKNCANISHRTRKTFENPNIIRKLISPGMPYVISGGHDCLVRCWDIENPQKSFIIGQDPALRPSFTQTEYPDVKIIQENPFQSQSLAYSINKSIKRKEYSEMPNHRKCSHTDVILDISLVTQPKTLLLTASRDGTIKAWN